MTGTALQPVPEGGTLVQKKPSDGAVSVTKVTKSEEAVFKLRPGKDAIVRLAAALQPFAPVFDFVSEGLQVSARERNEGKFQTPLRSRGRHRRDDFTTRQDNTPCDGEPYFLSLLHASP